MRITITGATGLIGSKLVAALQERGDEVTVLTRDPSKVRDLEAHAWDPAAGPAAAAALEGRDAVVHLAGEKIDQRWSGDVKRRIRESREQGTRNLVEGIRAVGERPGILLSASGVGYYGPRGDEPVPEDAPPGDDFLAGVCVAWEAEARKAGELGVRVVTFRQGVVLGAGGALSKMLPFFKLGVGGPVAGGKQRLAWIHADDVVGMYLSALDDGRWSGPVNATAPEPPTNAAFSKSLGRAIHRPAALPVPGFAVRLLYGDMATIVVTGQNAVPQRATELGYRHRHPDLDQALKSALSGD
jgi:uncharacterized protein (TIGR01777 family)